MSTPSLGKRKSREEDAPSAVGHGSTLFVSNLPYGATSTDLQTTFSDLAPVRSAFVVLEHGTGVSKGVGYVSFSIKEDAQTAFDTISTDGISINGRKLRVQWADSKPKDKTKDRPKVDVAKKEREERPVVTSFGPKSNDPLAIRTIIVSGLPPSIDSKALWKKLRKFEGAEKVEWPAKAAGGEDASTANVLFSTSSLAQEAVSKLHAHVFKGSLLSVTLKKRLENLAKAPVKSMLAARPRLKASTAAVPSRASRLIVRNLPFDITEQDLRAIFLPYGPIYSIHIPQARGDDAKIDVDADTKPSSSKSSRSKGFAFVWMLSKKDGEVALEKCNGMKVRAGMANDIVSDKQKRKKQRREEKKLAQTVKTEDGEEEEEAAAEEASEQPESASKERVIAVDWALSKEKWQEERAKLGEEDEALDGDVEMGKEDEVISEEDSDEWSGEESEEDGQLGLHEDGSSDEEEGSEDEDEDDAFERDSDDQTPIKPQLPQTDTGTTLFIRNIPFAATEDELRTLFRAFGPLRYARITVDPDTERSRGTGFACFWNKEDADKVIEQSDILRSETMGNQPQPTKNPFVLPSILTPDPSASVAKNLVLQGRTLDVVRAVTRDQATKLKEEGEKSREKADKRNLYLLREGVILPNTPAAETIPPVELEKRTISFNARRAMLRSNPSLYVSKTRLSIRQIPIFVTERVLKRLAIHSVREFKAEVEKGLREGLSPDELAVPPESGDHDVKQRHMKKEEDAKSKKRGGKPERPTSVQQAKIVRQQDRVDPVTGKGRSRGYGFVEMHKHADALRVLRWANNNPEVGTLVDKWWKEELADLIKKEKAKESPDDARIKRMKGEMEASSKLPKGTLIVEFSIENIQVVQRRAAQQEKVVS
ncbi:hypothetical protein HYDPIDRAFT_136440 [Hydnomerulius pinastri MD-312]|uniref:Unplaced genomic scaffold scaffold_22, whole genome shotgun sequence n=2 Tax=Hydnomerulius pinastri MD-312 TaxID=994086 RepID=A0A0C9V9E3_9AGAM|nr:hypothetical protein HYDPIDRAFT_136440 [Hydnomerulius pinastri MD-312]